MPRENLRANINHELAQIADEMDHLERYIREPTDEEKRGYEARILELRTKQSELLRQLRGLTNTTRKREEAEKPSRKKE